MNIFEKEEFGGVEIGHIYIWMLKIAGFLVAMPLISAVVPIKSDILSRILLIASLIVLAIVVYQKFSQKIIIPKAGWIAAGLFY